MRVRDLEMHFGERTYVMGIINVRPTDSVVTGCSPMVRRSRPR